MTPTIHLLLIICSSSLAADLFTFVPNPPPEAATIKACQDEEVLTCTVIEINFSALDDAILTLPRDCRLSLQDLPAEGSFTFSDDNGTTATFTRYETAEGHMEVMGNVQYWDGRDFTLEPCRAFHGCHVWMEEDEQDWVDEESIPVLEEEMRYAVLNRRTADPAKIQQGKDDSTTIVTYSVMFYYTPEFAAITENIPIFVSQVIAETNQGYINSGVPVRVRAHCIAAANIHDIEDAGAMIGAFRDYKPTEELLNSADSAALLVKKFGSCGIGTFGSFMYGNTISVTMKSCALGYYSFGHEVGHNFGCSHDAKQGSNSLYAYGLGKHIPGTGKRTIMAYNYPGFGPRINWWSNPAVMYEGVATGTAGENNARVLREHRFAFAAIGDESRTCGTSTVTPGPTTATSGVLQSPNFPSSYPNKVDKTEVISVADGNTVKIKFSALDVESHRTCGYDYVTVVDANGEILLGKTCGNTVPSEFESKTNKVNVIFHTDSSETRPGWKLTWTLVTKAAATGVVKSKNYPGNYNNDMDKDYTIQVAAGKKIKISFNDFYIESHSSCRYDYLMITDGSGSQVLGKSCGRTKPGDVTSATNKVVVKFHSDNSETRRGFKLTWTEV